MPRARQIALVILSALFVMACSPFQDGTASAAEAGPPYPPSSIITGIAFEWHTHKRHASGSDNWPITWSANDHQYTAWGDGSGFGGTGPAGRVSLGIGRIEGTSAVYKGYNVWGGKNPEVPAEFEGKSYGIIALGTNLYMWRCGTGGADLLGAQHLYKSIDNGRNWVAAGWEFPPDTSFYCPAPLQFGKGYAGARDRYVYVYAAEQTSGQWGIHKPGKISLMRAPQDAIMSRNSYEFFVGRDAIGNALWSSDINARRPVIEDQNGLRLVSAIYNPGLDRYLIGYAHTERGGSDMSILDGPTPWGPWTTVMYDYNWGVRQFTGSCCLLIHFAPKWWLDGGRRFTVVFSGGSEADSWNTVEGTFRVNGAAPPAGMSASAPQASASSATDPQKVAQKPPRQPVKAKRPEPQDTLTRPRSSQPDGGEGASTPDGTAPPTPKPRRQIYVSGSSPTSPQPLSGPEAKPAQQRPGIAPARSKAATVQPAEGQLSPARASATGSAAPAKDRHEPAGASQNVSTGVSDPSNAPGGEPHGEAADSDRARDSSAAATPPDHPAVPAAAEHVPPKAALDLGLDRASTTTSAALPLPPALEGAQPSPGPRVNAMVPRRRASLSASRQPAPAAPVRETVTEAASTSYDALSEPRLVGTMVHGRDSLAIVVPAGASEPVTVRAGDMLGLWSVASIERHTLALRAGDRALELHLFQETKELGGGDTAQ
jgi:hypothetical protein